MDKNKLLQGHYEKIQTTGIETEQQLLVRLVNEFNEGHRKLKHMKQRIAELERKLAK